MRSFARLFRTSFALLMLSSRFAGAQSALPAAEEIAPRECLAIRSLGRAGRSAVHTDPLEAQIVSGQWKAPHAGDRVSLPDGRSAAWTAVSAGKDGSFTHEALEGGYAYLSFSSPSRRVMILEASAHGMAYVNGEPRTGDPYEYGMTRLPVLVRQGTNELLLTCGRGHFRAKLVAPKAEALFNMADPTLPDLRTDAKGPFLGAVVVVNASERALDRLTVTATSDSTGSLTTKLPPIPPLSVRKVPFRIGRSALPSGNCDVMVRLNNGGKLLDTAKITLGVRRPNETQKRTFVSAIDGSVQYYALNPAQALSPHAPLPALILTLHGASVEAIGQASAYLGKSWAHLVAPTNRRPFGFDWEDWGRLDALEVLEQAQKTLKTDPARTYLTGHSMGGHGTWQMGVTFPDKWAAIGPSAGWISFFSYAGGRRYENPNPIEAMLQRAVSPSDTLALANNYKQHGVYILHGGADDNVPVEQAREMSRKLASFHHDVTYFEQPGAGHWWGNSDEPGAACVDWPPMFDFFLRHALPTLEGVRQVDFTTASPGVSAWCRWAGIEQQIAQMKPSAVNLRYDPGLRRFVGTTENVARLALDVAHVRPGSPISLDIDGQKMPNLPYPEKTHRFYLLRDGKSWILSSELPAAQKGPHRTGPFKNAFRNRMLFVYGTKGNADETAWAIAKARYDAETFWYRGNGSIEVVADTAFDPKRDRDRNIILYGNADTNAAWSALLADSPVQARHSRITIGERTLSGDDLACLFLRPRPGSAVASVGVVTGSGLAGLRLTDRLTYFVSGVAFPDVTVMGPEMLTQGSAGIRCAGFFGNDWSVTGGEFAWK